MNDVSPLENPRFRPTSIPGPLSFDKKRWRIESLGSRLVFAVHASAIGLRFQVSPLWTAFSVRAFSIDGKRFNASEKSAIFKRKRVNVDETYFQGNINDSLMGYRDLLFHGEGGEGVLCLPHATPLNTPPSVTRSSKFKELCVLYSQQGRLQLLDCTVCPTYLTSLHPECVAHSVDKSRQDCKKASLKAE